jgi:hypothetical protein
VVFIRLSFHYKKGRADSAQPFLCAFEGVKGCFRRGIKKMVQKAHFSYTKAAT